MSKKIEQLELTDRFETEEKDNEDVSYICTFKLRNYIVELLISDFGQCYFIKYKNLDTNEIEECGLGTYNTYYLESIVALIDSKGEFVSSEGIEAWDELTQTISERWIEKGWADERPDDYRKLMEKRNTTDYDLYDFDKMYKNLEEQIQSEKQK